MFYAWEIRYYPLILKTPNWKNDLHTYRFSLFPIWKFVANITHFTQIELCIPFFHLRFNPIRGFRPKTKESCRPQQPEPTHQNGHIGGTR
jgi:hypothetical protein